MTRDELIVRTRQLVDEGDRLRVNPSLRALQLWLQLRQHQRRKNPASSSTHALNHLPVFL